jgi:hypothetical protein
MYVSRMTPRRSSRVTHRSRRLRTEWADFNVSAGALAANVASHQNISTSIETALGVTSLNGSTILRTLLMFQITPDAGIPANGAVRARAGLIVQDLALAGAATDGPLSAPYRDWFGMAFKVYQNGSLLSGSFTSISAGPSDLWEFRSKRKLRDITDGVFIVGECDVSAHWTVTGRMLVTVP